MKNFKFDLKLFCLALMAFLYTNSNSQTYYLKSFYSPSFGTNPMLYNSYNEDIEFTFDTDTVFYTFNSTKFSMGSGNSFGLAAGRIINDYVSVELGVNYFKAKTNNVKSSTTITYQPLNAYNVDIKELLSYKAQSLNFVPSISISGKQRVLTPYCSLGFIFSFINFSRELDIEIYNNFPGYYPRETYQYAYKYSPNYIFGWSQSLGIEYAFSQKTNFYLEASHVNLNYSPEYMKCIKYQYNLESIMHKIEPHEEIIYFVDSYSSNKPSQHGRRLSEIHSFSSFALQFGVKYFF